MALPRGTDSLDPSDGVDERRCLDELLHERGLQRYGLFFLTGEGKRLPDGSEEVSGFAVDEQDRVFFFWTGWDRTKNRATFSQWKQVPVEEDWGDEPEYQEARKVAGLGRGPSR